MKATKLWFTEERIFIETDNGKTGSLSIREFPRLLHASESERNNFYYSDCGIHWPEIDEDLSFEGFFSSIEEGGDNPVARAFKNIPEINVSQFARYMNINESLLAKYICGARKPSRERAKQIEKALHKLANELSEISL